MSYQLEKLDLTLPNRHGEVLVWPDRQTIFEMPGRNHILTAAQCLHFFGRDLAAWRKITRYELIGQAIEYNQRWGLSLPDLDEEGPLVMTGHQACWFHCGILAKYILACWLARMHYGVVLNLVVDQDLPGPLALQIPDIAAARINTPTLNAVDPERPMEQQPAPAPEEVMRWRNGLVQIINSGQFVEQGVRMLDLLTEAERQAGSLTELMVLINHKAAEDRGLTWLNIPVSQMAESTGFLVFLSDCLRRPRETAQAYNEALREYRRCYGLRSRRHPVPDLLLATEPTEKIELPFWCLTAQGKRAGLFIRTGKNGIELFAGRENAGRLSPDDLSSADRLKDALASRNSRIRPRALALTLFTRLFLGDVFIHGVGGAYYDQITDAWLSRMYPLDPPAYACASATMHIAPEKYPPITQLETKLRQISRARRDCAYNPQRYLTGRQRRRPEIRELMDRRQEAIENGRSLRQAVQTPDIRRQRREIFERIHELNETAGYLAPQIRRDLQRAYEQIERDLRECRTACHREYFFGLFGDDAIKYLQTAIANG